jgi:hypothetical protein
MYGPACKEMQGQKDERGLSLEAKEKTATSLLYHIQGEWL